MASKCKRCAEEIVWYQRDDRWIPLSPNAPDSSELDSWEIPQIRTLFAHDCSNPQTYECKFCQEQIYFSKASRRPLDVSSHLEHECEKLPKKWA